MGGHEPPCSCPELSPGPLQEQQVLTTKQPLHSPRGFMFREEIRTLPFSVVVRTKWNVLVTYMLGDYNLPLLPCPQSAVSTGLDVITSWGGGEFA